MLYASSSVSLFILFLILRVEYAEDSILADANIPLGKRWEPRERPIPYDEMAPRNLTVYLGHANNPFGPSTRLHKKENKLNISFPHPMVVEDISGVDSSENSVDGKTQAGYESRSKRGVIQLYNMVSCATGCNPLIYKGYGCYCGFLGSGYPVDGIDRCCKNHDWCYDTANCKMYLEYIVPYYWKCYNRRSLCAIDHLEWGGSGSCAQRLCECDRVLSECLSRYPCPSSRAMCTSSPWRLLQNAFMIF